MSGSKEKKFKVGDVVRVNYNSSIIKNHWTEGSLNQYFPDRERIYTVKGYWDEDVKNPGISVNPDRFNYLDLEDFVFNICDEVFELAYIKDTKLARKLYKDRIKEIKDGKIYLG